MLTPDPKDPTSHVPGMKKVTCCKCLCPLWANDSHKGRAWCSDCSDKAFADFKRGGK